MFMHATTTSAHGTCCRRSNGVKCSAKIPTGDREHCAQQNAAPTKSNKRSLTLHKTPMTTKSFISFKFERNDAAYSLAGQTYTFCRSPMANIFMRSFMQFQDSESRLWYLMTSVDFWNLLYYRAPYDHGSLHVLKIKFYALTLFSRTIDTHVYIRTNAHRTQLQLKNRATHLCKCNVVAVCLKPLSHMCYHAEFGCSRSNHV